MSSSEVYVLSILGKKYEFLNPYSPLWKPKQVVLIQQCLGFLILFPPTVTRVTSFQILTQCILNNAEFHV